MFQLPVARVQQPDLQRAGAGDQVADRLGEAGQRGGHAGIRGPRQHEEDGQAQAGALAEAEDQHPERAPSRAAPTAPRPGPAAVPIRLGTTRARWLGLRWASTGTTREVARFPTPISASRLPAVSAEVAAVLEDGRQPGQRRVVQQALQPHERGDLPGQRVPVHLDAWRAGRRGRRRGGLSASAGVAGRRPALRYLSWGSHSSTASAAGAAHTPSASRTDPPELR